MDPNLDADLFLAGKATFSDPYPGIAMIVKMS